MLDTLKRHAAAITIVVASLVVILGASLLTGCDIATWFKFSPPSAARSQLGLASRIPLIEADSVVQRWQHYVEGRIQTLHMQTIMLYDSIDRGYAAKDFVGGLVNMGLQTVGASAAAATPIGGIALLIAGTLAGNLFGAKRTGRNRDEREARTTIDFERCIAQQGRDSFNKGVRVGKNGGAA